MRFTQSQKASPTLTFIAGAMLASSANFALACDKPKTPAMPDPATAVTPQMIKAKNDVKAFVSDAETYLNCNISTSQHNKMVDEMNAVAEKFNKIVRAYKARLAG